MWNPSFVVETGRYQNEPFKNVAVFCVKAIQLEMENILFLIANSTKTIEALSFIV